MAGNIQVINPRRTGFQEFTEAANPYIQQAFVMMLQRKAEEQQRQQDLQRAVQLGIYQPQYEQIGREISGEGLKYPAMLPPQEQSQFYVDIGKKKYQGKSVPEKYLKFSPEGARTLPPGFKIPLGTTEYTTQQPDILTQLATYEALKGQTSTTAPTIPTNLGITGISGKNLQIGETPEAKQEREVETTKKKKAQEVSGEIQSIDNMINVVWKQADELIPAKTEDIQKATISGLGRKIGTTIPGRIAGMGDQNAIAFSEFQEGTLSMLIRSLGEKGMLTNQDIARARQFEPSFYDTPTQRKIKKQAMSEFLKSKVSAYMGGQQSIQQPQNIPQIGQTFNGEKVINVRRIE